MLPFLLRRINYIRFFITYYTFLISILCTTLRMSVFNEELLTYLVLRYSENHEMLASAVSPQYA